MTASWKYLRLCFALAWMVLVPGTLILADTTPSIVMSRPTVNAASAALPHPRTYGS